MAQSCYGLMFVPLKRSIEYLCSVPNPSPMPRPTIPLLYVLLSLYLRDNLTSKIVILLEKPISLMKTKQQTHQQKSIVYHLVFQSTSIILCIVNIHMYIHNIVNIVVVIIIVTLLKLCCRHCVSSHLYNSSQEFSVLFCLLLYLLQLLLCLAYYDSSSITFQYIIG